jgi:hypothetical protein
LTYYNVGIVQQYLGIKVEALKHILKMVLPKTPLLLRENMENKLKLKEEQINYLLSFPEQGMDIR